MTELDNNILLKMASEYMFEARFGNKEKRKEALTKAIAILNKLLEDIK